MLSASAVNRSRNSSGKANNTLLGPAPSDKLKYFIQKLHQEQGLSILTAHQLPHTYGTMLRRKGVTIYTIQKIPGHKDIRIPTETYVHNEFEVLKKELLTKAQ